MLSLAYLIIALFATDPSQGTIPIIVPVPPPPTDSECWAEYVRAMEAARYWLPWYPAAYERATAYAWARYVACWGSAEN